MASNDLVSVITPTYNREAFLSYALKCFLSQDYKSIEWLILDDSERPSKVFEDIQVPNISYQHERKKRTIGEKRNLLIERARGEMIVQFDDDDYYAPTYVRTMVRALEDLQADLINLRGWFLFDRRSNFFGYWDLLRKTGLYYCCDHNGVVLGDFNEKNNHYLLNNHLGYGFSYAFRKAVWRAKEYPHIDWNEDGEFSLAASASFSVNGISDTTGIALHLLHLQSTSRCFPQYHLPVALLPRIFPAIQILPNN